MLFSKLVPRLVTVTLTINYVLRLMVLRQTADQCGQRSLSNKTYSGLILATQLSVQPQSSLIVKIEDYITNTTP